MKIKWKKGLLGLAVLTCVIIVGCSAQEILNPPETESSSQGESQTLMAVENNLEESIKPGDLTEEAVESEISTEPAEIEQESVVTTVTITATGDCSLGSLQTHGYAGSFHEYYDTNGEEYFFADVKAVFENDDFTLVNLEGALTESTNRVEKEFSIKGKPEYTKIMTSSSVEGCSLGNNHTRDYGESGLNDTIAAVQSAGLVYGYNDQVGMYTTEEGILIGVVSASLLSGSEVCENYIGDGIANLKQQGADIVIAACHWGIEKEHYATEYQQNMAHKVIDWGADVVIGNHPHVLQGIETYNGKVICYSLGNFSFGGNRNPADKNTMIYQQTFTFVDGVLQEQLDAKIIPCTISSSDSRNDFQPNIAEGERKTAILALVNEYSKTYSNTSFDENGRLVLGE